jgi:DNA-binding transcriptional regulator YhcF (GntR family)
MLPFSIHVQDGLPVSDQLVQAVRKAILTEELAEGDLFPSVRTLSLDLRISPTTAHKAVAQLKDEGYLASRPGIGMVVTGGRRHPSRQDRLDQLRPACQGLLREASALNLNLDDAIEALRRTAKESRSSS